MKKQMKRKYSLNIFLMKDFVKNVRTCIKQDKNVTWLDLSKDYDLVGQIAIAETATNTPSWLEFLSAFSASTISLDDNTSNRAVMFVYVEGRIMALTFGYGKNFLVEEYVESDFGFWAAINLLNPQKIRSIYAATIEDMVIHSQKQASYATEQNEFSINTYQDIMTSIAGEALDENKAVRVSGRDSLLVTVEMEPGELYEKLKYYLDAYTSNEYKEYFSWIENIRQIRDKKIIDELEKCLIKKIESHDLNNIYISPPDIIDWNEVNRFFIRGIRLKKGNPDNLELEQLLELYWEEINNNKEILEKLKRDKLEVIDLEDEYRSLGSMYNALVAQVQYEDKLYILSGKKWYLIEEQFYDRVVAEMQRIPESNIDFPICNAGETEGEYNKRISEKPEFCLMDKRLVGVLDGPKKIEACDIFTNKKQMIHVKKKYDSANLSHLFAQGKVSAECFMSDENYRKSVFDIVKVDLGDNIFDYRQKPSQNEFEIVYAIISKKVEPLEKALPFFSMVNLMMSVQELDRMHMRYSVKIIQKEEKL